MTMQHMRKMNDPFTPVSQPVKTGFWNGLRCNRCYAVVDRENIDRHERWHQELAAEFEGTQQDGDEDEDDDIISEARAEVERIEAEREAAAAGGNPTDGVEQRRAAIDSGGGNTTRRDPRRGGRKSP